MPLVIAGKQVGPIGYGMGSLTTPPKIPPQDQAIECLKTAADIGCLAWNAGEFYGPPTYNSLVLLSRFYEKYPEYVDKVVLNVKGGMQNFKPNGSPEYIRESVENCLKQLGKGKIDQFECARKDPTIPFETTLRTLKKLVDEGKIGSISLTEVNATTIREASAIVPISSVEIELSLWTRDPLENGILSTCAELDIPVYAYCPVGRGVLAGALASFDDIPEKDYRRMLPRYQPDNLKANVKLVAEVEKLAEKKGWTTAQVALGWLLGISKREGMPVIIPIPGTATPSHVRENAAAQALTAEEMEAVESILSANPVAGERYHAHGMKLTDM